MIYRYYSPMRPVSIGTYPKNGNVDRIINFPGRMACGEIRGRKAWGYIEYTKPLTQKEIDDYELIQAGT